MQNFNQALGLTRDADGLIVLDTRPEHQVAPGIIHFAVLATLGEVAAADAVGASVVPANISVNLLRAARPGRLEGRGRVLQTGRRLAVVEGEVTQAGELVAKVTVNFAVMG